MVRPVALLLVVLLAGAGEPAWAALQAQDIAVLYNRNDRDSRILAGIYAEQRGIPQAQRIGLDLNSTQANLPADAFTRIRRELAPQLPAHVQALALVWHRPYRVNCMSITSAFAFGFDRSFCATGCRPTAANPYFGAVSDKPFSEYGVRLAMLLNAGSTIATLELLERGAQGNLPGNKPGAAYLVNSPDRSRNTRAPRYALAARLFAGKLPVHRINSSGITARSDIMFYFIGAKRVPHLDTLGFVPGAVADHLTSVGGDLDGDGQMPATAWIRAGATGSYGTVVEPCNFPQKFPDPPVVMAHYLNGDTLVEAYWKSVRWPGQGLFLGDPLARPFAPHRAHR